MTDKIYLLVLVADLVREGRELGPMSKARLSGALNWANGRTHEVVFCLAAGKSPAKKYFMQEETMASMAASWLRENRVREEEIEVIPGPVDFNTRGEFKKFVKWAKGRNIPFDQLGVASAWWHINKKRRARRIFQRMFGEQATKEVTFVPTAEEFPPKLRLYEAIKSIHSYLPARVRVIIERLVFSTGLNPSF